ncbi:MAG TPA: hypothetical protein VH370_20925 [Humisphaera sp.]|jgi:hypothetical protein|nr:hypothetical protein [Humisphaera sp.]
MADRRIHRRAFIPISLALIGAVALIGCSPIPIGEHRVKGTDYRPVAGNLGQYLQEGRTTRQQLEAKLGPPQLRAGSGRFAGYVLQTNSGVWVMPLCFKAVPINDFYMLQLEYDDAGLLVRYDVRSSDTYPWLFTIAEAKESDVTTNFSVFPTTRRADEKMLER